jgi:prepilin signal peptidase PulO-like enzyme (type II secretory pathway)
MTFLYGILIFYLGSLFASFAYVIGLRIPKEISINKRSYCDNCEKQLPFAHVLPIFGYMISKGRCSDCQTKIPLTYLIYELLGGALFVLSYIIIGEFSLELLVSFIFITVFLVEVISDIYYKEVIDMAWIVGLVPIVIIRIIQEQFLVYLFSASILFVSLFLIAYLGKWIFKKEALGGGDIKIYIFIGFIIPIFQGLLSLFLAAFFGLFYALIIKMKPGKEMAFIPMIFMGVLISYFFGELMIEWYLNLLGM